MVADVRAMKGAWAIAFAVTCAPLASARADEAPSAWVPYGALAAGPSLEPFGGGSELDRGCVDLGAASCATPVPLGAMLLAHAGYAKAGLGFELAFAGGVDISRPSATFDGTTHKPYGNPLLSAPAREEDFILLRGGGTLALRARVLRPGPRVGWTFAAGLGASYKYMALEREVTTTTGLEDRPYFSRGTGYVSPTLSLDGALLVRAGASTALSLGVTVLGEMAWQGTRSVADDTRHVAGDGAVLPIATPAYRMASGPQIFLVPYLGVTFGP